MEYRRDPPPLPRPFDRARPHRRALASLLADDPTLLFVNAGMVPFMPYFLGRADAAVPAGHQRAEVRPHPRHRGGRQDHPARHVLPDERQLLLRRLLQGRRDPVRLGAAHRARSRRRLRLRPETGSGPPSTSTTTRPSTSGTQHRGRRPSASSAAARPTTTGTWACPARAARARRSTSTAAPSTAPTAARSPTRTGSSRSGTSSSCSTSSATVRSKDDFDILGELPKKNIDTGMGLERVATSCRASTTCTRSTSYPPSSTGPPS